VSVITNSIGALVGYVHLYKCDGDVGGDRGSILRIVVVVVVNIVVVIYYYTEYNFNLPICVNYYTNILPR